VRRSTRVGGDVHKDRSWLARRLGSIPDPMHGPLGPRARELRRNRQGLLDIAATHGVHHIRVFGSLARGEAGAASDVAFLLNLAPGRTLLDLAAFRREAEQLLGASVGVATSDMLKERIRANVLAEAVPP
jgi:predicted nucleotidyltransferase